MACSCPGLVAQLVEGREFESHPGQSFSLPLCWSISLPGANTQIGQLGNFSALQFTLKKKNKTKQNKNKNYLTLRSPPFMLTVLF